MEKDFRFIIAFVPSTYKRGANAVEVIPQNITMKDFMVEGYDKGRYKLKSLKKNRDKRNFKIKVNYMGKKIEQLHGILVGMGFKIAVSNRSNKL